MKRTNEALEEDLKCAEVLEESDEEEARLKLKEEARLKLEEEYGLELDPDYVTEKDNEESVEELLNLIKKGSSLSDFLQKTRKREEEKDKENKVEETKNDAEKENSNPSSSTSHPTILLRTPKRQKIDQNK